VRNGVAVPGQYGYCGVFGKSEIFLKNVYSPISKYPKLLV
jgi:hypothetical protein